MRNEPSWLLAIRLNPFKTPSDAEPPLVRARGDLERAEYRPISSLKREFNNFITFGMVGLMLTSRNEDMYAAVLQYRYYLDDGDSGDTMLVQVAREADTTVVPRRDLIMSTSKDAAMLFLMKLSENAEQPSLAGLSEQKVSVASPENAYDVLLEWTGIIHQ